MNKLMLSLFAALLVAVGVALSAPSYVPTASAQGTEITVCSHNGTSTYNILGGNAATLREKLTSPTNFGPTGAYGDYTFKFVDVGDSFTRQTIEQNKCNIWFSGYEADNTYTPDELNQLQDWVQNTSGQVVAGCDNSGNDPVCALLDFSVADDQDTHGFITETSGQNPLNCNGALGPNSRIEMAGGVGAYFSGPGVKPEYVLAVHETNGVADPAKPIVIYTGKYFLTADINMIEDGQTKTTLSSGAGVSTTNDILTMNAFSALADASVGKARCSSVEPAPTPSPVPATATPMATPTGPIVTGSAGDVHILTPDGLIYDFQEVGDYILTQSTSGDVKLHARQERPADNPNVSVNTAAAMWVAGDSVVFYGKPERALYINGQKSELPTSEIDLPQGGRITFTFDSSQTDYTIFWPDNLTGARVMILSNGHLDIGIGRLGSTLTYEGILGDLDDDSSNDIQIRSGELITPPASIEQLKLFGDSWRVPEGESLFDTPAAAAPDAPTETLTLLDVAPEARAAALQTCQEAGITNPVATDNCTYDVAVTGDPAYVESAQAVQEAVEAQPEPVTYEPAVPAQLPMVGQQYAVADAPGTFRYFQLTELPAEAEGQATMSLCPDLVESGTVNISDLMTDEGALSQGLTATNQPCTVPVDESGAELPDLTTGNEGAAPTEAPAGTDDSNAGATATEAPAAAPEATAPAAESKPGGGLPGCGAGMIMPLFLAVGGLALSRRRHPRF